MWLACISTTSHTTSSPYFPIKNGTTTCLITHFFQPLQFIWFSMINYFGLVSMVPTSAHFVSLTKKIRTTFSLNALILKRYGGKFMTDATFLEWGKTRMNGLDGLLSLGLVRLSEIFLVNWVLQLRYIVFGKNGMQRSLQVCLEIWIWSLIKSKGSFATSSI
jgi:hypothetical protein